MWQFTSTDTIFCANQNWHPVENYYSTLLLHLRHLAWTLEGAAKAFIVRWVQNSSRPWKAVFALKAVPRETIWKNVCMYVYVYLSTIYSYVIVLRYLHFSNGVRYLHIFYRFLRFLHYLVSIGLWAKFFFIIWHGFIFLLISSLTFASGYKWLAV